MVASCAKKRDASDGSQEIAGINLSIMVLAEPKDSSVNIVFDLVCSESFKTKMDSKNIGRLAATGLLFFGTISSLTSKIQLSLVSAGYNGVIHNFSKPGMQVLFMFLGMSFALLFSKVIKSLSYKKDGGFSFKEYLHPIFSSICGSTALFIMITGLNRINVSIYMMLRGGQTLFSTLFSIQMLNKTIKRHQWIGVGMTIFSLCIVGFAGVQIESAASFSWKERLIGVIYIIIAQVIQGWQMVYDEYMLSRLKLPIMFVVGMEGAWGLAISFFYIAPLAYILPGKDPSALGGSLENIQDSFLMLGNSSSLLLICAFNVFAVCFYDISGMTVTGTMSSMHRTIFESLRPLTTWISMLLLSFFGSPYGEKWVSWSWLELGGFICLILSSMIFNEVITL